MKLHSLVAAALLAVSATSHAGLIHQYELDGNLVDAKGGADLHSFGGVKGPSAYAFKNNTGLELQFGLKPVYTIDMSFQLAGITTGYQRLLDFKYTSTDYGLYVNGNQYCFWQGNCDKKGTFTPRQDIHLTVTRDAASLVTVYQDGKELFHFQDSLGYANLEGRKLSFFQDDGWERATGTVDFIHIYDHALSQQEVVALNAADVPEPASFGLVGAGLALLGWTRRRKPQGAT